MSTQSTSFLPPFALVAVLLAAPVVFASSPLVGREYLKEASVSLDSARAIALETFPGKIVGEELEREGGGSGLRYSFDIKRGKITQEVGVDSNTGAVLENSVEGPDAD